jgi:hypothetical protein
VSGYGVAARPNSFCAIKILQVLNVQDVECYVVETNYITQLCTCIQMGFIRGHSFVRERKSEFYEEVERTRYNFRPCCGTHLDL